MDGNSNGKSLVTVKRYMGDKATIDKINELVKAGKNIIIIGNITDFFLSKDLKDGCGSLSEYIGGIRQLVNRGRVAYIPGEKDLQLCTELHEIIESCKNIKTISPVSCVNEISKLRDKEKKLPLSKSDIAMVITEILKVIEPREVNKLIKITTYGDTKTVTVSESDEKKFVFSSKGDTNTYLAIMQNLDWIQHLPIYIKFLDADGESGLIFSHKDPDGRDLSPEELSEKREIVLNDVINDLLTVEQNKRGNTLTRARNRVKGFCEKYLNNPEITPKSISESAKTETER